MFDEISGSLALLQLSRYEPFGLTVAESLALGVPVIVTPAVGAAQFVADDVKVVVRPGVIDRTHRRRSDAVGPSRGRTTPPLASVPTRGRTTLSPRVVTDTLEDALSTLLS